MVSTCTGTAGLPYLGIITAAIGAVGVDTARFAIGPHHIRDDITATTFKKAYSHAPLVQPPPPAVPSIPGEEHPTAPPTAAAPEAPAPELTQEILLAFMTRMDGSVTAIQRQMETFIATVQTQMKTSIDVVQTRMETSLATIHSEVAELRRAHSQLQGGQKEFRTVLFRIDENVRRLMAAPPPPGSPPLGPTCDHQPPLEEFFEGLLDR